MILFPTLGWQISGGWELEMHGCVFEPERPAVAGVRPPQSVGIDDDKLSAAKWPAAGFACRAGRQFPSRRSLSARKNLGTRPRQVGHFRGAQLVVINPQRFAEAGRQQPPPFRLEYAAVHFQLPTAADLPAQCREKESSVRRIFELARFRSGNHTRPKQEEA